MAKAAASILFALLALATVGLQSAHFSSRENYRDDEIRTVHAGMTLTLPEVARWMSVDIHPPLWRMSAAAWVWLFGPDEAITRFSSTLYTLLALAFLYRLAGDLFDRRTALLAVFLLGTHALFQFYAHEFRPYAALILWTTAMQWAFLRWLRRPGLRYGLLYVGLAAAALYTHFFALFVVVGQVAAFVVLARFDLGRYIRACGLFAAAGLAFTGWLPSFLHSFLVTKPGGISYGVEADGGGLSLLYTSLQIRPLGLGNLLAAVGLLMPVARALTAPPKPDDLRFGREWGKVYLVVVAVVIFGAAVIVNSLAVNVLTQRNLITMLPSLVILAALALRALPWQVWTVALLLILNPAVREFVHFQRNQPYREALAFVEATYEDGDPIVLSVNLGTGAYFTYAYYLMDQLPGRVSQTDMFYLTQGEPAVNLPDPPRDPITSAEPAALRRFGATIADAARVFWITDSDEEVAYAAAFRALLERDFVLTRTETVESEQYRNRLIFSEYRRAPAP